jgi:hypothetical protein
MTWQITNIANTDTFQKWLDTTNYVVNAISTSAVTTGNVVTGSVTVNGTINSSTLVTNNITINANLTVNAISVGNSTVNTSANSTVLKISNSTASMVLSVPTAAQVSNGQYYHNANGSWALIAQQSSPVTNGSFTTSGVGPQTIDSYLMSSYISAEYLVNISDNNANNRYISKILTAHNGSAVYSTEYAAITTTGTSLGVFSTSTDGTSLQLVFTPVSSNTSVKFTRVTV